jgi:tripartite-type tricarboxylate transporter receptor subunit TctC
MTGVAAVSWFLLWALAAATQVSADDYPSRPITLIVQFSPGAQTDILARKLGEEVSKILGQPIVVVNKTGGGGTVGVAEMLRAKPDGYTIGCVNMPSLAIIPHMQQVPYDPLKDISHICVVQPYEYGLYVKADAPWKDFKEFVDYAAANPGKVIYGSLGAGTTNHLIVAQIIKKHGLNMKHVPYKGDGELIPAMLGGHVHAAVGSPAAIVPQVKAGNLRVLVVTSKDPWSYLPQVPTLLTSGYDFYQSSYFSLGAPAGVPEAIRKKLEDAFAKVLQNRELVAEVEKTLFAKIEYQSGAWFEKYIREQHAFYKEFLKKEGLVN